MRSIAFTAFFFLLALFSAVAYAAPVVPEGAIVKRQQCGMYSCKDAVTPPTTSSDPTDPDTVIGGILAAFYQIIGGSSSTSANAPAAAFAVSGTSSAPATSPTGL